MVKKESKMFKLKRGEGFRIVFYGRKDLWRFVVLIRMDCFINYFNMMLVS